MFTKRSALAAAIAASALVLTACSDDGKSMAAHEGMTAGASPTSAPASSAVFNDADVMFAQMMIPHHEQAVEMADLAATRAADPEVKELAEKIKEAQDPEIATMESWLREWGKPVPTGGMGHDMPGIMSEGDMKKLEAAKGTEFDKQFVTMMIAHHEGAIDMARTEEAKGVNPEAKALAKTIVTTQQAEIDQMEQILARF
ncbi:DUF305 domain-containing protein [Nonomuraea sp. NPDC046570]|uniref:DUF305 domain-containing protein n=1 Tax=Nonomuraea sp. NPDC046570 TaxID=3155255 RepID=UPI003404FE81